MSHPLPQNEIFDGRSFLPQVKGKKGNPRDWVFIHHDPLPGHNKIGRSLSRWIQDKQYQLFDETGHHHFFDFTTDPELLHPIDLRNASDEIKAAHAKLKRAMATMDND